MAELLTRRQLEVLGMLVEMDEANAELGEDPDLDDLQDVELVREGGQVWIGAQRLRPSTLDALMRCAALSRSSEEGRLERWTLNDTGRAIHKRPALAGEVFTRIMASQPFTIRNGRIADLEESPHGG